MDFQETENVKQTQRQLDAKGGHAGKLKMSRSEDEHSTSKLNLYEKVLLKRLINTSHNSEVAVIYDLYTQHVETSSRRLIRRQNFETIQMALKALRKRDPTIDDITK